MGEDAGRVFEEIFGWTLSRKMIMYEDLMTCDDCFNIIKFRLYLLKQQIKIPTPARRPCRFEENESEGADRNPRR